MIGDHHAGNMCEMEFRCIRRHPGGGEILAELLSGGGQDNHGHDLVSKCSCVASG